MDTRLEEISKMLSTASCTEARDNFTEALLCRFNDLALDGVECAAIHCFPFHPTVGVSPRQNI
jgi:hypothetical protein